LGAAALEPIGRRGVVAAEFHSRVAWFADCLHHVASIVGRPDTVNIVGITGRVNLA
jgi:hypothetical protein